MNFGALNSTFYHFDMPKCLIDLKSLYSQNTVGFTCQKSRNTFDFKKKNKQIILIQN